MRVGLGIGDSDPHLSGIPDILSQRKRWGKRGKMAEKE